MEQLLDCLITLSTIRLLYPVSLEGLNIKNLHYKNKNSERR